MFVYSSWKHHSVNWPSFSTFHPNTHLDSCGQYGLWWYSIHPTILACFIHFCCRHIFVLPSWEHGEWERLKGMKYICFHLLYSLYMICTMHFVLCFLCIVWYTLCYCICMIWLWCCDMFCFYFIFHNMSHMLVYDHLLYICYKQVYFLKYMSLILLLLLLCTWLWTLAIWTYTNNSSFNSESSYR